MPSISYQNKNTKKQTVNKYAEYQSPVNDLNNQNKIFESLSMGAAKTKSQLCHLIDMDNPDRTQKRNYSIANILLGRFTLMMLADSKDSSDIIQLLISFKADWRASNLHGMTVVDYVIVYGAYRVLLFFKEKMGLDLQSHFENLSQLQIEAVQLQVPYVNYQQMEALLRNGISYAKASREIYKKPPGLCWQDQGNSIYGNGWFWKSIDDFTASSLNNLRSIDSEPQDSNIKGFKGSHQTEAVQEA